MTALVRAAGAVLWRPGADGVQILLIHRPRYDDWSLPKGKLDPGEDWADGAVREVTEETGCTGTLGPLLATVHYVDHKDRPKEVRYYEMARPGGEFAPNDEVDEIVWLDPAAARRRVTRRADADVITALCDYLEEADRS